MTIFSAPVALSWPRPVPYLEELNVYAAAARISDGIALVGWSRLDYLSHPTREDSDWQGSWVHLAAVRYTDFGPVPGPTYRSPAPSHTDEIPSSLIIEEIVPGHGNEAWVLAVERPWYDYRYTPGTQIHTQWVGRAQVDPGTLELRVEWRHSWRRQGSSNALLADSWPEERLLILVTPSNTQRYGTTPALELVHMDTGALIASLTLPPSVSNTATWPVAMAFNKALGKVMILGERRSSTSSFYFPTVWTAAITPTSIGAWTMVGHLPTPSTTRNYYPYGGVITATPEGWELIYNHSSSQLEWFYHQVLAGGTISPATTLPVRALANFYWDPGRFADIRYDAIAEKTVMGLSGHILYEDTTGDQRGRYHYLEARDLAIIEDGLLPRSERALPESSTSCRIAVVGADRYIYLVSGSGITKPRGNDVYDSFEMLVYSAGPEQAPAPPVDLNGETYEERANFRRMD